MKLASLIAIGAGIAFGYLAWAQCNWFSAFWSIVYLAAGADAAWFSFPELRCKLWHRSHDVEVTRYQVPPFVLQCPNWVIKHQCRRCGLTGKIHARRLS
jgi:hypothetical protein